MSKGAPKIARQHVPGSEKQPKIPVDQPPIFSFYSYVSELFSFVRSVNSGETRRPIQMSSVTFFLTNIGHLSVAKVTKRYSETRIPQIYKVGNRKSNVTDLVLKKPHHIK